MKTDLSGTRLMMGVPKHSLKENEHRLPLHPDMFTKVPEVLREQIWLEEGYGSDFGVNDSQLRKLGFRLRTREQIIEDSDIVLLPKPTVQDLSMMRQGATLWGWPHCVQDEKITQVAIDRNLTLLAFEAMFEWDSSGHRGEHTFRTNNELAGFSSVTHALQLSGQTGWYGPDRSAAIIGFGATGKGALKALVSQGFSTIYVLSRRDLSELEPPAEGVHFMQVEDSNREATRVRANGSHMELKSLLASCDVIVNCTLQDPTDPWVFLDETDLGTLKAGTLIVDVSCDQGMGFSWARPTSFIDPCFYPRPDVTHYAVDHSPSLYWKSATWELSAAVLPFLSTVLAGPEAWKADATIRNAVEIDEGTVRNPSILTHQNRDFTPPHLVRLDLAD